MTIHINLSDKCNISCGYCFSKRRGNNVLDIDSAIPFIDGVISHCTNYVVLDFTGASEPLMAVDSIYTLSKRYGGKVGYVMTTNGLLLTKGLIDRLAEHRVRINISMDGKEGVVDSTYGAGAYKHITEMLEYYLSIEGGPLCSMVITDKNDDFYQHFTHLCDLGFEGVHIGLDRRPGKMWRRDNILKSFDLLAKGGVKYIRKFVLGGGFGAAVFKALILGQEVLPCAPAAGGVSIAEDGELYCCMSGVYMEDMNIGSLSGGVNSQGLENNLTPTTLPPKCLECGNLKLCGGICKVYTDSNYRDELCKLRYEVIERMKGLYRLYGDLGIKEKLL